VLYRRAVFGSTDPGVVSAESKFREALVGLDRGNYVGCGLHIETIDLCGLVCNGGLLLGVHAPSPSSNGNVGWRSSPSSSCRFNGTRTASIISREKRRLRRAGKLVIRPARRNASQYRIAPVRRRAERIHPGVSTSPTPPEWSQDQASAPLSAPADQRRDRARPRPLVPP